MVTSGHPKKFSFAMLLIVLVVCAVGAGYSILELINIFLKMEMKEAPIRTFLVPIFSLSYYVAVASFVIYSLVLTFNKNKNSSSGIYGKLLIWIVASTISIALTGESERAIGFLSVFVFALLFSMISVSFRNSTVEKISPLGIYRTYEK